MDKVIVSRPRGKREHEELLTDLRAMVALYRALNTAVEMHQAKTVARGRRRELSALP